MNTGTKGPAWTILAALLLFPIYAAAQPAPTLTTLHFFAGYPTDGADPVGGVVMGADGVLHGTTYYGGPYGQSYDNGWGTVFSLVPPATPGGSWTEIAYNLTAEVGERPNSGVALGPDGIIYGITEFSCTERCQHGGGGGGNVFQITPPTSPGGAWAEKAISDNYPVITYSYAPVVIGAGGVIYGTSWEGATLFDGVGDVFAVTPPTSPGGSWTTESIYNFNYTNDGSYPEAPVTIGAGGVLYGTTTAGGIGGGSGIVYSLTPPATSGGSWTETILYTFGSTPDSPDNPNNAGVTIGPGGVLYGTTLWGGAGTACSKGCGTVYSLKPPSSSGGAWTETTLYSFPGGSDGNNPNGGVVIGKGGVLYGTTTVGGTGTACPGGCGTVFSLTPPASPGGSWTETVLHSFNSSDGANPSAGVTIGNDGALYGTTRFGGIGNNGTVFRLK